MKIFRIRKKEKKQVFNFDEKNSRYQLILDMDNTLIYSSIKKLDNYKTHTKLLDKFYVYKRPHLDTFLETVKKFFTFKVSQFCEIIIYTAGTPEYANAVLDYIDKNSKISKRLFKTECIKVNNIILKDVSRYLQNICPQNLIIIDDIPEVHISYKGKI